MRTVTIGEARHFSLKEIQKNELLRGSDLRVRLLCFEAGQRDEETSYERDCVYQVLEGEALVHTEEAVERLGKGKLLHVSAAQPHRLENAGGGLLVVMATNCA